MQRLEQRPQVFPREQSYTNDVLSNPLVEEGPARDTSHKVDALTGRFTETEIAKDKPWSAFGQTLFVKEIQRPDGSIIKKIAAVSMSYPAGVGERMGEEILTRTLLQGQPLVVHEWNGTEEGKLLAVKQNSVGGLGILDTFIAVSGDVIQERHGEVDHEFVRDFFRLQEERKGFLPRVKQDALAILNTPFFTGRSAFNPDYQGKGVYVLEMIYENGVLYGATPNGEKRPLSEIAADKPHAAWLAWLEREVGKSGDMIIGHVDSTETVKGCGGADEKCCAKFFEKMDKKEKKVFTSEVSIEDTTYKDVFSHPTIFNTKLSSSESGEKEFCKGCKHTQSECSCVAEEIVAQAA